MVWKNKLFSTSDDELNTILNQGDGEDSKPKTNPPRRLRIWSKKADPSLEVKPGPGEKLSAEAIKALAQPGRPTTCTPKIWSKVKAAKKGRKKTRAMKVAPPKQKVLKNSAGDDVIVKKSWRNFSNARHSFYYKAKLKEGIDNNVPFEVQPISILISLVHSS